eukprot:CAMPEP_0184294562 /NCGR_PEP_ID=MMETSP1049-20130417/5730_1 /TAXON_ID=77928 /ORGANISM="Proteomonas sulcata, Strain CCMP704" /LENGTH=298 /DNA_ID=CAMNT_0026602891 /DNA_START=158 /DNA_END=1051 /DNA_ORIENTATION=+
MAEFPAIADGWEVNAENKDLKEPIPWESLGVKSAKDLKVTLVHRWFSPPSAAIRCILNYYQVPQERISMEMPFKGNISNSPYKQVPQLVVSPPEGQGDKGGYLVVDSWVIIKNLYPILTGSKVEEDIGDDAALKEVVGKLPLALQTTLMGKSEGPGQFARHFAVPESRDPLFKVLCSYFVQSKMGKLQKKFPETFEEKMQWFMDKIKSRNSGSKFFSKTKEPGPVDLAVYAYIANGLAIVQDKAVNKDQGAEENWIMDSLKSSGSMDWFTGVDEAYKAKCQEAVIPEDIKEQAASSVW